jgi:hypothetical protein
MDLHGLLTGIALSFFPSGYTTASVEYYLCCEKAFNGKQISLEVVRTFDNKLLIYKAVIKPIWMYGCELWGCASRTNIHIIQRFQ